jgi:alkanesulfonate monooxygenase SsuD/methylene tetrahydromethanopterin reductase-like flavin-dependent oxidoreductase (luciferase family)
MGGCVEPGGGVLKSGFIVTTGDPRTAAQLAAEAEIAGWDGVFYWDGIAIGDGDTYDPWVVMAAMAMRTERVRLGAIVTPPPRRRPWKLARETMTLDRLSNGRLVFPVGLGALDDGAFGNVGEPTDNRVRAELLDESLEIVDGLWTGEPFGYEGRHYRFAPMTFRPTPVQRPRIPIWVVGAWPHERSMRRVLRYDGIVTQVSDPAEIRAIAEYVAHERDPEAAGRPFDIIAQGRTPPDTARATAEVQPYADAGATWWIDGDWELSLYTHLTLPTNREV